MEKLLKWQFSNELGLPQIQQHRCAKAEYSHFAIAVISPVSQFDITPTKQAIAISTHSTEFKKLVALVMKLSRKSRNP